MPSELKRGKIVLLLLLALVSFGLALPLLWTISKWNTFFPVVCLPVYLPTVMLPI